MVQRGPNADADAMQSAMTTRVGAVGSIGRFNFFTTFAGSVTVCVGVLASAAVCLGGARMVKISIGGISASYW
jgi:hypothetical protein